MNEVEQAAREKYPDHSDSGDAMDLENDAGLQSAWKREAFIAGAKWQGELSQQPQPSPVEAVALLSTWEDLLVQLGNGTRTLPGEVDDFGDALRSYLASPPTQVVGGQVMSDQDIERIVNAIEYPPMYAAPLHKTWEAAIRKTLQHLRDNGYLATAQPVKKTNTGSRVTP